MKQYHIIEIQNRADGINNVQSIESRNSLASGLSYYYDRCSKMAATTLYQSVTLMMIDSDGHVYENKHITTSYVMSET